MVQQRKGDYDGEGIRIIGLESVQKKTIILPAYLSQNDTEVLAP